VYAVPGVPHEMKEMLERAVLPDLQARSGEHGVILSRVLRTWGESESGLNERLDKVIARLDVEGDPTIAFLARGWEGLEVRLTTRQDDESAADAVLDEWESQIRELLGPLVFGVDEQSMEVVVLDLLREHGLTLSIAESLTGGLVSGRLTAIPGASDVFRGAVVSYASDVKFDLLEVSSGPVVNEPAAIEMAEGVQRLLGADVGLSLTGVAGPSQQDDVPVGTVCIGLALPTGSHATTVRLGSQRDQIRQFAVISSLDLLRRRLELSDAT
jgi:nicotinamide-nucleotide amidase